MLQWEHSQQNGTGAIPAPVSLHAHVLSLAQLQLARDRGSGAAGHASVVHMGQLSTYRTQHKLASGIICIDFLHLSRGLCPCCFGTAELRVDGVCHSLHEAWINIQEGAKQIS